MAANTRLAVAAHVVCVLASREERVSSFEVAASVNTNPALVRRVLAALARAGIVESELGPAGGSRLRRRPAALTLWDLHAALGAEPVFAVHRNPCNPRCWVSGRMKPALAGAFAAVDRAVRAELRAITVSELLEG